MTSHTTTDRPIASPPDRIIVDGLVVETFIGVDDDERLARQRVRFDVEVETVEGYMDHVRTSGAYVSYADIVAFVERRAADGDHVELVETWAEDVAEFALGNELAAAVRVTVRKLDVFEAAHGVGITIERRRRASDPAGGPA